MGGISRGLDFLKRQQEAAAARANQENIWKFWIRSGESARFYFLGSDVDNDMLAPMVHSIERTKKDGQKFPVDVLCERESRDEPRENCQYCVSGAQGPWHRLISWVYVDQVIHPSQDKPEWALMKRGNAKVFVETPDPHVRLFIMKTRMAQQVMSKYDENLTLFDRYFKLEKSGTGTSTLEILSCPDDATEIPAEVKEANANLKSLEEAIRSEFGRWAPAAPKSAGGAGLQQTLN